MKSPHLLFFASRFPAFARATLLLATVCVSSATASETSPQQSAHPSAPVTVAAKPAEDRDALLARVTKVLNYGSEVGGYRKPSKSEAVIALGLIGDERSVPVLIDHLQNEENNQLRLQIVRALGWIGSDKAVPALEQSLHDKYPYVRKQAAEVLKGMTGRDFEYDKTGLPDLANLRSRILSSENGPPVEGDTERLDAIAQEVATRRELRQVAAGGSANMEKKKIVEPVDIVMADQPARLVAKTYSDLTGKLVLVSPKIAAAGITCKIEKATLVEAKTALNKALLDTGVQVVELERGVIAFTPVDSAKSADKLLKP